MNQAIFLDRDGTINESDTARVKHVNHPDELYLLPGVADAIAKLRERGYLIFVVTNQGGVGSGFMTESTLAEIHARMRLLLQDENLRAVIDDIVYCPHHPQKESCACRKPRPGMLLDLAEKYQLDLAKCWMIGDRQTDIEAGQAAGCQTYLVNEQHSVADFAQWIRGSG